MQSIMLSMPKSPLNVRLIVWQLIVLILAPIWVLKLIHYFAFPMPCLFASSSLIPTQKSESLQSFNQVSLATTFRNLLIFGVFFLQHIFMAKISFKSYCTKIWPMFPTYEKHIYNTVSSILIIIVLEYQLPQNYVLFTLPSLMCLFFAAFGAYFFIDSNLQLQGALLIPYKISELFSSIPFASKKNQYDKVEQAGIIVKGSYSLVRHPMQCGLILTFTFGSPVFSFEKVVLLIAMISFIIVGVIMEQGRLLKKYKQYENYTKTVKKRFIPYII